MTEENAEENIALAEKLADDLLYPNALAVETGERPLRENLDALAEHGIYGAMLPREIGGLGADFPTACRMAEILASGCVCTTLTVGQHQGITATLASKGQARLRERFLPGLATGAIRTGAAFTGAIPGPPKLTVRETPDGYRLDGAAPWISGWGMVDVLGVAARNADDDITWLLVDAEESPSLRVRPQRMIAATASNTVTAEFTDHPVPADRLVTVTTQQQQADGEPYTKRLNGSLVLGVARRCVALLGEPSWRAELDACRAELDALADVDGARARAADLAVRAASAAIVAAGSSSVLDTAHPQRLLREAGLMLVFASRPGIRDALLARLER